LAAVARYERIETKSQVPAIRSAPSGMAQIHTALIAIFRQLSCRRPGHRLSGLAGITRRWAAARPGA